MAAILSSDELTNDTQVHWRIYVLHQISVS